jgi:pimeloyl-ACP methyl ester carboxylesterase
MSSDPTEPPINQQEGESGGIEVSGFRFSAATLATLVTADLSTLQLPQMLIIESSTTGSSGDGVNPQDSGHVARLAMPGLVEMLMTPPQFAVVPKAVIAAALDWLLRLPSLRAVVSSVQQSEVSRSAVTPNELELNGYVDGSLQTRAERAVFFGTDGRLFGIVTTPPANEVRRRAVILLNAGADHHIGASRLYVSMARRWSQHGYVVLRMDLGGVGDSGTRPGRIDDDVFPPEALSDIAASIEYLRKFHGTGDITLAGLCSGAYHALRAAVALLPVQCILMVNPQNYFWRPGETLQGLQLAEVAHNPGLYRERVFSLAAWKRMVTGRVNVLRIGKIYMQRPLLAAESKLRNLARRLHIRLPNDLGTELEQVVSRGVRVVFVFARGEPGISLLKLQAGTAVQRLAERCHVHIIDSGDHVFTRSGPRATMEKVVTDELIARPEWVGKSSVLRTGGLKLQ